MIFELRNRELAARTQASRHSRELCTQSPCHQRPIGREGGAPCLIPRVIVACCARDLLFFRGRDGRRFTAVARERARSSCAAAGRGQRGSGRAQTRAPVGRIHRPHRRHRRVEVRARVSGYIERIAFKEVSRSSLVICCS